MDDPAYLQPSGLNHLVVPGTAPARSSDDPRKLLTPRERQVLVLIADGKTSKQIAATLGISFKTATCHRMRIMQKLNVHKRGADGPRRHSPRAHRSLKRAFGL